MTAHLTVDKAGRIVLPKSLRDKLRLPAGTLLQMESEGENITLRPIRPKANLAKEFGIWVYQGGPSDDSIPALIDQVRQERLRDFF